MFFIIIPPENADNAVDADSLTQKAGSVNRRTRTENPRCLLSNRQWNRYYNKNIREIMFGQKERHYENHITS